MFIPTEFFEQLSCTERYALRELSNKSEDPCFGCTSSCEDCPCNKGDNYDN
jgi:hypothetical protein